MNIKKNILFIAHSVNIFGGANRSLLSILNYLKDKNTHNFSVLIPKGEGKLKKILLEKNINFYQMGYSILVSSKRNFFLNLLKILYVNLKFLKDIFIAKKLVKIIKKNKFNLIYTNTRVTAIGLHLKKLLKIKHIMHVREVINENDLITYCNSEKIIQKFSDKIIVISEAVGKTISKYWSEDKKIQLIYNSLNVTNVVKSKNFNQLDVNIIVVGTIIKAKNQEDIIKATHLLNASGYKVKLFVVGSDPNKYKKNSYEKYLKDMVIKLKMNNVYFLGENENIDEIRKDMDIEVICSKYEAFGRVILEAMRMNLILIGSNSGAIPEIVDDKINAVLYENGNHFDLSDKIINVIKSDKFRNKIKSNSKLLLNKKYNFKDHIRKVLEVIKD